VLLLSECLLLCLFRYKLSLVTFGYTLVGLGAIFEVFTAVKIQVGISWVVTLYRVTVGCQRFRSRCSHLQGEVKVEAARSSETSASYRNTTRRHKPQDQNLNYEYVQLSLKRTVLYFI
jgi:hypothetical protein